MGNNLATGCSGDREFGSCAERFHAGQDRRDRLLERLAERRAAKVTRDAGFYDKVREESGWASFSGIVLGEMRVPPPARFPPID